MYRARVRCASCGRVSRSMSVGKVIGVAVVIATCLGTRGAAATKVAATYYFAGGFGTFLTAVPPRARLHRRQPDADIRRPGPARRLARPRPPSVSPPSRSTNTWRGSYAFEPQILGGRLQVGAAAPVVGTVSTTVSLRHASLRHASPTAPPIPASATCCSTRSRSTGPSGRST